MQYKEGKEVDFMNDKINANRFSGFAGLYENVRPSVPDIACNILIDYLGKKPDTIVDLGCGTGLSTVIWEDKSEQVIGIDPSEDMLAEAKSKRNEHISFIKAFSDNTTLPDLIADIIVCSQSFHWMEPNATLTEVNRILKPGGIFAAIDCDWPPVCDWRAEKAYQAFMAKAHQIQRTNIEMRNSFRRWDKNEHLSNIKNSGYFRYSREVIFLGQERCSAERFSNIAFSQSAIQTILKTQPSLIEEEMNTFSKEIKAIFNESDFNIGFCYRMRIGVK